MAPVDLTLRTAWLDAMRSSTERAIGIECECSLSEHDADTFDPIGLLAYLAAGRSWTSDESERLWRHIPATGSVVPRRIAAKLLLRVGVGPWCHASIVAANDAGEDWGQLADWIEQVAKPDGASWHR